METKKRRQPKGTVIIGRGAATVRIYPFTRKDGYKQNNVCWHEGGRRRTRCFSDFEEAELIGQQISVRLANQEATGGEVRHRDIEIHRHCERLVEPFGVALVAVVEEWVAARKIAPDVAISEAVRYFADNGPGRFPDRTTAQVANEFVASLENKGMSISYVSSSRNNLRKFTSAVPGKIAEVTVADVNGFLTGLKKLSPVSKNGIRRNIVTLFSFAKRQGYLHPDRKTAAELSERFKEAETEIAIFTPEEMERMLLAANVRILPMLAIGAFGGIRSAEIQRLTWSDVKWDRGHIVISGRIAKNRARRLVPLTDNLKAWLAPWREARGAIVPVSDPSGAMSDTAIKAGIPGGWRQNGLRHSFISYRVAETGDVARTALEAGNSPKMIFKHYRAVVDEDAAKAWFSIMPPAQWPPQRVGKVGSWMDTQVGRPAATEYLRKTWIGGGDSLDRTMDDRIRLTNYHHHHRKTVLDRLRGGRRHAFRRPPSSTHPGSCTEVPQGTHRPRQPQRAGLHHYRNPGSADPGNRHRDPRRPRCGD